MQVNDIHLITKLTLTAYKKLAQCRTEVVLSAIQLQVMIQCNINPTSFKRIQYKVLSLDKFDPMINPKTVSA